MENAAVCFLVALLLSSIITTVAASRARGEYRVRIVNEMGRSRLLKLHCKSGDDDLGEHYVSPGGKPFEFGFRVNFFGSTLFFCDFWEGPDYVQHVVFDVFDAAEEFVNANCGGRLCTWIARDDGFYSRNLRDHTTNLRQRWGTRGNKNAVVGK